MDPGFLATFLPKGLPGIASSSQAAAVGGTAQIPWYQGDQVVNFGAGDVRTGDRTAPAPLGTVTPGGAAQSIGGAIGASNAWPLVAAGVILVGALLWKLSR